MKLDGMTKSDMTELLGELEAGIKSRFWQILVSESLAEIEGDKERLVDSSDEEDERLKGEIRGKREELTLVNRLIEQLKSAIKGGE